MAVLECRGLTKSFDGLCAVDDVNIALDSGKITALLGPNGAGKTTLFYLINGYLKSDKGAIIYNSREIQNLPPWVIANMGIGRLFQDTRVFSGLTVLDNIMVAFKDQHGENPIWAALKIKTVKKDVEKNSRKAIELIKFVGLDDYINTLAGDLSFGQQKLLSIARLLANEADLLLMDEPTAGVDQQMKPKIISLVKQISRENNKTIVIIEHNMEVVVEIAEFALFMNYGKIEASGSPKDLLMDKMVTETYIGL